MASLLRQWVDDTGLLAAGGPLPAGGQLRGVFGDPLGDEACGAAGVVDAYASSHQAAREAIGRFDRSLGRGLEIETPHRELGIELSL